MRPFILDALYRSLNILPGIGPRSEKHFERLAGGGKILDLLWHVPIELIDRSYSPNIDDAEAGRVATLKVKVKSHTPSPRRSIPYRVTVSDNTGRMTLVFFNPHKSWLEKTLPVGKTVKVSGKLESYQGSLQMVHPDYITDGSKTDEILPAEPVYPLTHGVTNKAVTKAMAAAIEMAPDLPEWLDSSMLKKYGWDSWLPSLRKLHAPQNGEDLEPDSPQRTRLAYDEFLANQLTLALARRQQREKLGRTFNVIGPHRQKLESALPFQLTNSQKDVLSEIDNDMRAKAKMMRLIQGDVGSGKTVVAALALMNAVDSGTQGAFMAPTEILARQHFETLEPLFQKMGLDILLLTGRMSAKEKKEAYQKISSGSAKIIIGTHALFQEKVIFDDLGLAVIDEQHRFGVHQRITLSEKGKGSDVLVMTATPIPRTLALTAYGDMDVSRITEKPPGRKPVDTRLIPQEKVHDMIAGLKRQIDKGARVYWVCPLVEESEKLDLTAAEERYQILQSFFGDRVGLIHGRMKGEDKDRVMDDFSEGRLDILVATTVIEVGVNVPEATVMVIEEAHRFGLAQLHQLRGRVGRGGDKSYCFLMYKTPVTSTAKERLSIMRDTEDGFLIAEKDMELRGSGDILGTKQSGLPEFKIARLEDHGNFLAIAQDDAKLILEKDTNLTSQRGKELRTLLYLFEADQAINYLKSG